MRKFSLLIALALLITVGGVYAAWVYADSNTDVLDVSQGKALNLTDATNQGAYGTYHIDVSNLELTIDPKGGSGYTTALYGTGEIVISFVPNQYAPDTIKNNGVESYFYLRSTENWTVTIGGTTYDIIASINSDHHDINWTKESDGTFSYTISASTFVGYVNLTEIELTEKTMYDTYDLALEKGQVAIVVSDGKNASQVTGG